MEKETLLKNSLYRTQYGSRLYGTNQPHSDTDWKIIFLPELQSVLAGNQILKTKFVSPNVDDKSTQVDEDFIPVQKFAKDFLYGVPYAIEVAYSLDGNHACQHYFNPMFKQFVDELKFLFLNRKLSGFLGFVNNIKDNIVVGTWDGSDPKHYKSVYHGFRIAHEAIELLSTEKLNLPFSTVVRDKLLAVKNGDKKPFTWESAIKNDIEHIEELLGCSNIQFFTPELETMFDTWLYVKLSKFYNIPLFPHFAV